MAVAGEVAEAAADANAGRNQGSEETPEVPYPNSLCHRCAARRYVKGRAALFVLCTALPEKYPLQPVIRCVAFLQEP